MHYICAVNTSDMTPYLLEMLQEMRKHLSDEDIRAGLPCSGKHLADVSPLYVSWNRLRLTESRQLERIAELDADIARMQFWGDFPMSRIDQMAQQGKKMNFWRCTQTQFEGHRIQWNENYNTELVSQQDGYCYFVTTTPQGENTQLDDAQRVEVAPSPVSTLITLQTKAKDSLRQIRLEMGDFSLQHYRDVEFALGLTDTIGKTGRRRRLLSKVKQAIRKIKQKSSL